MGLARKLLRQRVPSLSCLIAQISDAESFAQFVDMVKTYLPERTQEILHEATPQSQVARFASHFEDRYFPLEDYFKLGGVESYEDITQRIPLVVMGLNYEDYHEVPEWRDGAVLMTYLVPNPYEEEDILVSLAEACREHVPDALIQRAEQCRLSPGAAHHLLKGTKYEPLALWADWLHSRTGNFFLDTDYEMLMNNEFIDWNPENVKELTEQWKQAELHENKTGDFIDWLEQDLPRRFEELVAFIEKGNGDDKKDSG
jgi:hypothetical protein